MYSVLLHALYANRLAARTVHPPAAAVCIVQLKDVHVVGGLITRHRLHISLLRATVPHTHTPKQA